MSESMRLTAAEREALHQGVCSRHRDDTPGVYVCGLCERAGDAAVEAILSARLAAVEALADEWATEGPSLVLHAYGARDVHEGSTLERCATELRAALAPAATGEAQRAGSEVGRG